MDTRIACFEGDYNFYLAVSGIGFIAYPLMIPAFFWLVLYLNKNQLHESQPDIDERSSDQLHDLALG